MRGSTNLTSLFFNFQKHSDKLDFIQQRAPITGLGEQNIFGFQQKVKGEHIYVEKGRGIPIIFIPGLFGSFQNFAEVGHYLSDKYKIITPYMPMYDLPLSQCRVTDLSEYLEKFIEDLGIEKCYLAGSSMGGGVVLNYTLKRQEKVLGLFLFASSGLSLIPMRQGFFSVKDYQWVESLLKEIYYDPSHLHQNDIQEVFETIQNKQILLRCLRFVKSTKYNLLHDELPKIQAPTLLIWGKDDKVTPSELGHEFFGLMENSELHLLDECGHVPPHEKSQECLHLMQSFLAKHEQ